MITRETIDKIFETARIEEVIGEFVTLKKSGGNFKGLSPFSNEKTPSFFVSPSKQIFKDFSSGKGGNVVSFLMEHEHYTYPEALRFLAKKYSIEVEESGQTPQEKELRTERESLYLVNDFANKFFQEQLWETEEGKNIGLSYFRERGMDEKTIRHFQLGYSPQSGTALTDAALAESYQLDFLEKTGLTKVEGDRKRDRFWGRVIFPVLSHTGRVLGFGGRVLKKDVKAAKYLNSPESEIYHKSRTLYGIFQAKTDLSKEDECFLVEGYTDVISLYQAGIKNVVASSGTSLTADQINLIKRYTENITILYDGDSAGIKASLRGIDMILEEGMNVRVLLFPEGEDPDSFSRNVSAAELADYLREQKQDFLRFKASLLLKEAGNNPLEKSKAAREMVQSIAIIPDALQRDAYVKECARVLQMDEKILFSELAQIRKSRHKQDETKLRRAAETPTLEVVTGRPGDVTSSSFYKQEEALCWLLLNYGKKAYEPEKKTEEEAEDETIGEFIVTELATDQLSFDHAQFQEILQQFTEAYDKEGRILTADDFLRQKDGTLIDTVVDLISEKYELHNWGSRKILLPEKDAFIQAYTEESVLRFKEKKIGELISEIRGKLTSGTENLEEQLQMLNRLTQLKVKINKALNRVV